VRAAAHGGAAKNRIGALAAVDEPQLGELTLEGGERRLQTQVAPVAPGVTAIRSLDWDRSRFDIEFGLQEGTTYNSYIVEGTDGIALVDCSHAKFHDLYLDALKGLIDVSKITYLVVSHTEPDHSGLVPAVLELAPDAVVVGSKVSISFLSELMNKPFESRAVKGGDVIDLGGGRELEFVMAPNLHWPDSMFTYDRVSGVMFTCDAFGSHYCTEDVFDAELPALEPHFRFYYDCLMKPNARSVLTALRKTKDLNVTTIANGHGPLLRYNLEELVGKYASWSDDAVKKAKALVAVLYVSDYGFSDRLSQAIARGLTKTDVEIEMVDLNFVGTQELVEAVGRAAAVVLMTPPRSGPAAERCSALFASLKPKKQKVLVAESYGGDDEPVDALMRQFVDIGVEAATDPLRVRDTPTEGTYQTYEETGTDVGQLLTQKDAIQKKKNAMAPELAKALGRVSGGLYVVTAARGTARSAMIASWVAQASFEPLGFTVSVAKDRAIESLMQVGDTFVLNCLPEGGYAPLMKHFLKRFPPGADRFEGVDWAPATDGSPVLADAVAHMECRVVSRMDAEDHWVTYAEVTGGSVTRDGRTAAHHRKVASYY